MQCHYFNDSGAIGVLLRYPVQRVSWDKSYYPQSEDVLLPVASNRAAGRTLAQYVLETIPNRVPIVMKFCDPQTKAGFSDLFTLELARTFLSYSTFERLADPGDDVIISQTLNEKCRTMYISNGYSPSEVDQHFNEGARSLTLYEFQEPICTCFVFHNFETIWEIGGVHTLEPARRKGYGRKVVQKAVNLLLDQGCIPRYQVDETNTPSVQLAESIGMKSGLRFEHLLAMPKAR
jgi:predicted GNAT family acetyltransferase